MLWQTNPWAYIILSHKNLIDMLLILLWDVINRIGAQAHICTHDDLAHQWLRSYGYLIYRLDKVQAQPTDGCVRRQISYFIVPHVIWSPTDVRPSGNTNQDTKSRVISYDTQKSRTVRSPDAESACGGGLRPIDGRVPDWEYAQHGQQNYFQHPLFFLIHATTDCLL
jgi:hypothetical protein